MADAGATPLSACRGLLGERERRGDTLEMLVGAYPSAPYSREPNVFGSFTSACFFGLREAFAAKTRRARARAFACAERTASSRARAPAIADRRPNGPVVSRTPAVGAGRVRARMASGSVVTRRLGLDDVTGVRGLGVPPGLAAWGVGRRNASTCPMNVAALPRGGERGGGGASALAPAATAAAPTPATPVGACCPPEVALASSLSLESLVLPSLAAPLALLASELRRARSARDVFAGPRDRERDLESARIPGASLAYRFLVFSTHRSSMARRRASSFSRFRRGTLRPHPRSLRYTPTSSSGSPASWRTTPILATTRRSAASPRPAAGLRDLDGLRGRAEPEEDERPDSEPRRPLPVREAALGWRLRPRPRARRVLRRRLSLSLSLPLSLPLSLLASPGLRRPLRLAFRGVCRRRRPLACFPRRGGDASELLLSLASSSSLPLPLPLPLSLPSPSLSLLRSLPEPDEPDSESLAVSLAWLPAGFGALELDFVGVPPLAATNSAINFTNSALRCTTTRSSSAFATCFTQ